MVNIAKAPINLVVVMVVLQITIYKVKWNIKVKYQGLIILYMSRMLQVQTFKVILT